MTRMLKSSLLWQVFGGFVLGTLGILAFQPPEATRTLTRQLSGQVSAILPFAG